MLVEEDMAECGDCGVRERGTASGRIGRYSFFKVRRVYN
jgi:hypothetical protein